MKFNDLNGNGTKDPGEPGLSGWTILLKNETNSIIDTRITDGSGNYGLNNLRGNFVVEEVLMPGWTQSYPAATGTYSVTIDGQDVNNRDFGNYQPPSITIKKYTNNDDADSVPGPTIPVGNTVTWTYNVTNNGNVQLTEVNVTDDKIGTISCPSNILNVGASMTCTASGTAAGGQYENNGTASGK